MGCKRVTIFFILTHLRHDWDTGTVAPKVHKRCTRGAREVHERCTRGAREGHERGTRGAGEVHLWALKGTRYFSFWHGWDTVGTRLGHGDIGAIGAQEVHERGTRGAREVHERGTRGAREGHERGTRGAREVHRLTSLRPWIGGNWKEMNSTVAQLNCIFCWTWMAVVKSQVYHCTQKNCAL